MKMVKSLLLGSAAGLVAIAGAQAADLPVKAKPVQYVKICSLYGAGFYYIPGTDMCLKMGGWVRAEYGYGDGGSLTWGPFNGVAASRNTNNSQFRARGYITADARNQSEYGTIRSYIAVGISTNDVGLNTAANQFSANRAFIQLAGFTFGLGQSFFDFYSVPATAYWGAYPASDTGDPGWFVAAYTAQFGNGFSASISAEERRVTQIVNTNNVGGLGTAASGGVTPGGFVTGLATITANAGAYGGFNVPDIVGNLRIDQPWGSAQVMGALHQVNSNYYTVVAPALPGSIPGGGHPSDVWGWAVGGGIKLMAPMIGAGDYFQAQVTYTQGALAYIFQTPKSNWGKVNGTTMGYGVVSDAVYGGVVPATATSNILTTGWGVNAAYEHFWNKRYRTSLYGGYAAVSYSSLANDMLCLNEFSATAAGSASAGFGAAVGCNNNWSTWWIGSRSQWNVTPDTYLGLDVMYSKLKTATPFAVAGNFIPGTNLTIASSSCTVGFCTAADQNNWMLRLRVHRDFYP